MPVLVFLLLRRFGSSLQYDTLSILVVIHHNETENATERISVLISHEHTTLCLCAVAVESQTWWSVERINRLWIVAESQTNRFI